MLVEVSVVVGLGALGGIPLGLYGQLIAARWTEFTTDYQAPYEPALMFAATTLLTMVALAGLVTLVPAALAARIAPAVGHGEDD